MRKTYDAAFKAKVAFEAAKGEKTIVQIASEFSVHPNQIRLWRNHLMEQLPERRMSPFSSIKLTGRG
jgi:transposase-like protein